jgi:UDP-N-acetylglucosamine acyltransferase
MNIHPTALVDPAASLDPQVTVGPFAVIERDVQIGTGSVIGPRASVLRYSRIGCNCRIHAGAVIGDVPQDLAFKEQVSHVRIGDGCVIREYVTIHRGTKPDTVTELGNECFLMACSHVGHNCKLGNQVILANGVLLAGYVEVGERAFISGNAVVHQFVRIGRLAMLGGLAAISKDVPPFCTARSITPNAIMCLNIVGLRRAGFTPEGRLAVKRAFKVLYQSGLNVRQAVAQLRQEFPADSPASDIAEFVAGSKRGICRLYARAGTSSDEAAE